jgi:O-6-methylguanine DNA methyltransferase
VASNLPLDIRGTAFQQRVWQALRDIPPGETARYAEIAARIGHPQASRAVAQACEANLHRLRTLLVPWKRDASHNSRAGHPGSPRCSSLTYARMLGRHALRSGRRAPGLMQPITLPGD